MPLDPAVERAMRDRLSASAFVRWMGIEVIHLDEGSSEIHLPIEPHHLNPGGIVHGGIVATLIDAAIGLALRTTIDLERTHVTANLNVQYLASGRAGRLAARGRAVRSGGRLGFGEADLFAEDERLLAHGSATFLVLDAPDT